MQCVCVFYKWGSSYCFFQWSCGDHRKAHLYNGCIVSPVWKHRNPLTTCWSWRLFARCWCERPSEPLRALPPGEPVAPLITVCQLPTVTKTVFLGGFAVASLCCASLEYMPSMHNSPFVNIGSQLTPALVLAEHCTFPGLVSIGVVFSRLHNSFSV